MGGGAGAEAGGVESLPLAAGAEDEEDGLHAGAVGSGRLAAAEGMRVVALRDQLGDGRPQVIGNAPLVLDVRTFHGRSPDRPHDKPSLHPQL